MSWNKKYLTSSILLALAMPAVAADTNSRAKVNETVVVSASRSEQLLKDVTGSVSVITADDIEANLVKDIGEIFDYTPGVTVESDSRYGVQSVNIRGMEGNRVKIVVDGVSQANRFDSGQSFIQSGRLDIDPDMIKSAEVVKGAASSLYGSDAIGGIVSFTTKDPRDFLMEGNDTGGHAKLSYNSVDNSFSQSAAIANRAGKLESLVVYTHRKGDEEKHFGDDGNQDNEKNNVLVKLQYQINDENRIEFTGESAVSDTKTDLPLTSSWDSSYGADDQSERQRLGVKYILTESNPVFDSMSLQFDWQKTEQTSNTNRSKSDTTKEKKAYLYSEDGYELASQFNKQLELAGVEHNLVYGLSYATRDIENVNMTYKTSNTGDESTLLYFYMPAAEDSKYGAYLQDQISLLGGDLLLTPGVRFDRFETKPDNTAPTGNVSGYIPTDYEDYSDSAVTGRLGAVYSLNDDLNVFAQVSQGFRAPDFQELYYSYSGSAPGGSYKSQPNPDLKAETSITYETGLRGNFDAGSYEVAVFYSDYDDFIDTITTFTDPAYRYGVTTYDNLAQAKIKGVELGSQLFLGAFTSSLEGSSLQFAAAYTDGEDQDGKALNSVAPWSAVVGLGYDNIDATWGTSLKTVFTARKSSSDINSTDTGIQNQIENPSSTVVDLTAYYKPLPDLTLRAGVYNLTDTKYWAWNDVRGLTAQDDDLSQPERNYSVTVKYEF